MPQLLLQGFPVGAIRIGTTLSVLKKDGTTTYFVGADNHFSHRDTDRASQRYAIATLIENGHVRPCEVEASPLGIAHRTLMNWKKQLADRGPRAFFEPRKRRGESVMTPEKAAECGRLLDGGATIAAVGRVAGVIRRCARPLRPDACRASAPGEMALKPMGGRRQASPLAARQMLVPPKGWGRLAPVPMSVWRRLSG